MALVRWFLNPSSSSGRLCFCRGQPLGLFQYFNLLLYHGRRYKMDILNNNNELPPPMARFQTRESFALWVPEQRNSVQVRFPNLYEMFGNRTRNFVIQRPQCQPFGSWILQYVRINRRRYFLRMVLRPNSPITTDYIIFETDRESSKCMLCTVTFLYYHIKWPNTDF